MRELLLRCQDLVLSMVEQCLWVDGAPGSIFAVVDICGIMPKVSLLAVQIVRGRLGSLASGVIE